MKARGQDREVTNAEIGKGYEVVRETKGHPAQIVPISDDELRNLLALMESMTVEDLEELDAHDDYTEANVFLLLFELPARSLDAHDACARPPLAHERRCWPV